ncbi:unnamed protein product, partial [marine sediment metagenome]
MGQGYCDVSDCPAKAQSVINRETQSLADLTTDKIENIKKEKEEMKQKEQTEREKMVTTHEAAKLLYVTPPTVILWVKKGHIKCQKTIGKHRRIPMSEIERIQEYMEH